MDNFSLRSLCMRSLPLLLLFVVGLTLLSYAFWALLGYFVADAVFPRDVDELNFLRLFQLIISVGVFVVNALFLAWLFRPDGQSVPESLSLDHGFGAVGFLLMLLALVSSIPFINALADWNASLFPENETTRLSERLVQTDSFVIFLFNTLVMAVVPAVGEEFFFHGFVQNTLVRFLNAHLSVWIVAFVFSFIHFQPDGFVPRFLIGAFLGYLLLWSGSLWLPVSAHFLNNFSIVFFAYFFPDSLGDMSLETFGVGNPVLVILSIVLLSLFLFLLHRHYAPSPKN